MKVNLFTKMLTLLAVPLLVQLIAIVSYERIYSEIREAIHYQRAAMNAVRRASTVTKIILNTSHTAAHVAQSSGSEKIRNPTAGLFTSLTELQDSLEQLRGAGEPYPDLVNCTTAMSAETRAGINKWMDAALDSKQLDLDSMKEFKKTTDGWNQKVEWLLERPVSYVLQRYANSNVRQAILIATAIVILANVIVAIKLALFINKNIVAHVRRQQENFSRLSTNKPLLEPIPGSDEVAKFDRAFHDVVEDVLSAREERQEYLSIMNSSMRSPLVELETFAETALASDSSLTDKGKESLNSSLRIIKRLVVMLNELIDFDQIEHGSLVLNVGKTTTHEVIDNAIACVHYRARDAKVEIRRDCDDIAFDADPDRLVQVMTNLLTNAIKFSPQNSVIEVTVSLGSSEDTLTFSVNDQGRGVPEDKLSKIFMRYEQVEQSDSTEKGGTGLGLAICKAIVEAHGGQIWAENNAEKGARFSFSLRKNSASIS
jgi:signal transduction histidine kinase